MHDPLSEVIRLLQPRTVFAKRISGAGRWGVRYSRFDQPSFAAVLEGRCRLAVDGHRPVTLEAGDFVLLPATPGFTMSGFESVQPERIDPKLMSAPTGEVRHGTRGGRPDVRLLGGYFVFDSPDSALLVSLLPGLFHVRGIERLATLVRLVAEESSERRSGRELVLSRL
ncbi:MAG TPA: cupin domain-containing protein, partial [Polyangiaceae bacterium]